MMDLRVGVPPEEWDDSLKEDSFVIKYKAATCQKERQGRKEKRDHQKVYMQSKPQIQIETWHPIPYLEVGDKNDQFQSLLSLPYSQARRRQCDKWGLFLNFLLWYTGFLTLYAGSSNTIVF